MNSLYRPTFAQIDLSAIAHNARVVRSRLSGERLCAVVKANAYGHGALPVAQKLEQIGVDAFAVALVEEGVALRDAGIRGEVFVLAGTYHDAYEIVDQARLLPIVGNWDDLRAFETHARRRKRPQRVHIEFDTGMSRLGFDPGEANAVAKFLISTPFLKFEGLMSHLAHADQKAAAQNAQQTQSARALVALFEAHQLMGTSAFWHMFNSGGILVSPLAETGTGMVRAGLALYGQEPTDDAFYQELRPAMHLETQVVSVRNLPAGAKVSYGGHYTAIRPSRIATLPIGYADGYRRAFGNRAEVLIDGRRAPVVGRVCMDLVMVDVTDHPTVERGCKVVLLGHSGDDVITAAELALWGDTLTYEVLSTLGSRVPRRYKGS